MNTLKNLLIAAAIMALPVLASAGTAELQVIHNSADPGAAEVDVYVNGDLLLDDFAFRTATPFVEVPADVELTIGVAPGSSTGAGDILASFPVTLASGGRYLAVANGVLDPDAFVENPDGRSTGFTLFLQDRMASKSWWGTVSLRAVHGASDAPAVDIVVRNDYWDRTLYGGVGYGDIGGTKVLLASDRVIDVTLPGQPDAVVASYQAPLKALAREAFVVFASGFLDPTMNQDGAAFGLFAALADGSVVELPLNNPMARLQVIHNAADPGAAEVDVYVNGDLLLDDFAFRAASRQAEADDLLAMIEAALADPKWLGFAIEGPDTGELIRLGNELRRIMHTIPDIVQTRATITGGEPTFQDALPEARGHPDDLHTIGPGRIGCPPRT